MERFLKQKYLVLTVVFLAGFFIFQSFYSLAVPLTKDEAYHWEWSRHPAPGYYDHPPLIGWLMALTRMLGRVVGGSEVFWSRLPAVLSTTGILIIAYLLTVQLTGKRRAGLYSILLLGLLPLFSMGAILVTTDQPLLFFSGLTVFLIYQSLFRDRPHYWYYAGAALGLAFLSKFLSILLLPGLILFIILSPPDRYWLKRKEPYLAALIAGMIYFPNLLWNMKHDWVTFVFNLSSRQNPAFSINNLLETAGGQLGVGGIIIFPLLLVGIIRALRRGLREGDRPALFFGLLSCSIFGFFALTGLFRVIGAHWPAIGYLPAAAAVIYLYQEKITAHRGDVKSLFRKILHLGLALNLVLTVIIHLIPVYAHLIPGEIELAGREVNIDHSGLGFLYGWEELGEHLAGMQRETEGELFFITPEYAFSSLISFYIPGQPFARLFGSSSIYGQNYRYWNNFSELKGRDAVFVYETPLDRFLPGLERAFKRVEMLEPLKIYDPAGRQVRTIYFACCESFQVIE